MHDPRHANLLEYPKSAAIARRIAQCLTQSVALKCHIFRASSQHFANRRDLLTGEGARRVGARYTPIAAFPALYGSFEIETAIAEALGHSRDLGIPDAESLPLTFVGVKVDVDRVLDLTDSAVRRVLGISKARLVQPWRPCQDGIMASVQGASRPGRLRWLRQRRSRPGHARLSST